MRPNQDNWPLALIRGGRGPDAIHIVHVHRETLGTIVGRRFLGYTGPEGGPVWARSRGRWMRANVIRYVSSLPVAIGLLRLARARWEEHTGIIDRYIGLRQQVFDDALRAAGEEEAYCD